MTPLIAGDQMKEILKNILRGTMFGEVGTVFPFFRVFAFYFSLFPIYLIHPLALRLGYRGMKGQPLALQLLAASAVLVVGCYMAYHYVEKPGIKLGQRLAGGRLGAPLPLESTAAAP